ncbi:NAD(P)/FAD-dependent oxidoreductase [Tateyamaria omphalii]|uniref:FAD-binding domain-containing protein n=1 Tax=Tateyamaria omphalii TaxID=299262 RepID=A0A1P8MRH1_9RHOB|nr:tryptophan 7-halogenase [Tateyamaria omphalii]APX10645.1 hypothetical protein BWR18_02230 [Tateyamaria omphalii]
MQQVLIAGGGPAGLAAAIALAERKIAVTVVDPADCIAGTRAEMLAQGAGAIMQRLGLGHVLQDALRIETVKSMWGAAHLQSHGTAPGLGVHGWGLDRHALSIAMRKRARTLGVRTIKGRIGRTVQTCEGWRTNLSYLSSNKAVTTPYMIDATGRPGHIARRNGATTCHGPNLVAVLWHVAENSTAVMAAEATQVGWWYAAPADQGTTVGFVTSPTTAKEVFNDPQGTLAHAARTLTAIPVPAHGTPCITVDCRSAVLDRICDTGWVATGDAAAAFDPISSQGLFNALSGGFFAGNAVADAIGGDAEAPLVYAALAARTAERTHAQTRLQYAALPFDTAFWREHAGHQIAKRRRTAAEQRQDQTAMPVPAPG